MLAEALHGCDHHFVPKLKTILGFRDFTDVDSFWPRKKDPKTGELKKQLRKIPAAVLTRWHLVGEAAEAVWHSYILLFRCLQIAINIHGSKKAGNIASGMMPLMTEPEIFSDLALIKCYHECYFTLHMSWMMYSDDLTGVPGHQAHQILVRYSTSWRTS